MDREMILGVLEKYKTAVHTQAESDCMPIWAENCECVLISPAGCYRGVEQIYRDFLIGTIRKAYSKIDLLTENVELRMTGADSAVLLFEYSTDCIRRENGEPYGIRGLETQVYVREKGCWKLAHVHYSKV